jgi:CRP-like cAMP-binding protein
MLTTMEKILFLRKVPIFDGLSPDELKAISYTLTEEEVSPDQVVFRQGDMGDRMYIIVGGKVAVVRETPSGDETLATLRPMDFFGEMAVFDNDVRSATVKAMTSAVLLVVHRERLNHLMGESEEIGLQVIRVLSSRLRAANLRLE